MPDANWLIPQKRKNCPCSHGAATPTRSWVPIFGGAAQPRGCAWISPLSRNSREGECRYHHCSGVLGKKPGPGRKGQEAVGPKFGRGSATEAGVAVTKYIHPLVKVIIFPTSFSVLPWLRLTGRATRALTPASRSGSGIKIPYEWPTDYQIHKVSKKNFLETEFIAPSGRSQESFCPSRGCRLSRFPGQSAAPRGRPVRATAR